MVRAAAAVLLLFALEVSAKTIQLTWKDCGTPTTHAHVTGIKTVPDPPVLGQKTEVTGTGTLDEQLTAGKYEVTVKAGPFTAVDHKDNVCGDTSFDMKVLGIALGNITVHGPACPAAAGVLGLGIDISLIENIPGGIGSATVSMTAKDQKGEPLLCVTIVAKIVGLEGTPDLDNWESHGELMDEVELSEPAIHDEMVAAINTADGATWTAGHNARFAGASLRDAKRLMGTLQNRNVASFLPHKAPEKLVDLPAEFDWRTDPRAAGCPSLKEIRDQANCGSCWAFGSVEAMTDRRCIVSGGKDQTHLSAQDVTSCDHLGDMGCNGGNPATAYMFYKHSGVVSGGNYGDKSGCYSYQLPPCAHHSVSSKYPNCTASVKTPKCMNSACVDGGGSYAKSKVHGHWGYSVCGLGTNCPEAMQQEIYQHGPITGMFFVHQSFLSYKSGVYKAGFFFKDPMLGGHAIKILGWGTEGGAPYWLVANSWDEDWGMGGFFKIDRGHNQCQIENILFSGGPVAGMPDLQLEAIVV